MCAAALATAGNKSEESLGRRLSGRTVALMGVEKAETLQPSQAERAKLPGHSDVHASSAAGIKVLKH